MPTSYQHYQLRIHRSWEEARPVLNQFIDICDKAVVFEHPPDDEVKRIHVHGYFFNITLKDDAVRDRIKKHGLKGNTDFFVSGQCGKDRRPLDLSGAWQYGTKQDAMRPVFTKNISPAISEELQDYARRIYAKYGKNISPAASQGEQKQKKVTQYQHIKEIAANCLTPEFLRLDSDQRVAVVHEETWRYLRENGIKSHKWGIVQWTEGVLLELDDPTLKSAVLFQLEKNLGVNISHAYPYQTRP